MLCRGPELESVLLLLLVVVVFLGLLATVRKLIQAKPKIASRMFARE